MDIYKKQLLLSLSALLFLFNSQAQVDSNKLDDQGRKHGLWKGIYQESKRPRFEGVFNHGKESGVFKFFDDTKAMTVIATREFNDQNNAAYTKFFDQKGFTVSEGVVKNKLFEGLWKYYHHASTTVMSTENYREGKLEGVRLVYYLSGKIAEEINYKNNLKNGPYKKYAENGVVLEESIFKNDSYDGAAIFREANGAIASQGKFVNGQKMGIWQFFEKGKLVNEINMSFPLKRNAAKNK